MLCIRCTLTLVFRNGENDMSKANIAATISGVTGIPKVHANNAADAVIDFFVSTLKATGRVNIPGFGTFKVTARSAHSALNPRTGEKVKVAARRTVRFKASPVLSSAMKRATLPKKLERGARVATKSKVTKIKSL